MAHNHVLMNYLGIDYGEKRIGLSCGDDEVGLAVPIAAAVSPTVTQRLDAIAEVIRTRRIGELVVGYPYNMDGTVGFKAKEVDAFIAVLEERFSLPVHRTDERLTSSDAEARMREAGKGKSRSKKSIQAKLAERKSGELDSRAAALILQDYLDALPRTGMGLMFPEGDDFDGDNAWGDDEYGVEDSAAPSHTIADGADDCEGTDGCDSSDGDQAPDYDDSHGEDAYSRGSDLKRRKSFE